MFRFEYPVFELKNLLRKSMLDELRDYPLQISRMLLDGYGDGILSGCDIAWENNRMVVKSGLLYHDGGIYRMETDREIECPPSDRLTYLKVNFAAADYERDKKGGIGEIRLSEEIPKDDELELGRFRLQEGARLRNTYESYEDFQTEFDTMNRIHVSFLVPGGCGLWPRLLKEYARELLEIGISDPVDVNFGMQILGTDGRIAAGLVTWYVEKNRGEKLKNTGNGILYEKLLQILKEKRRGSSGYSRTDGMAGEMILL